jgi:hypothetical protein
MQNALRILEGVEFSLADQVRKPRATRTGSSDE